MITESDVDKQFQTLSNQYLKQFPEFNPIAETSLGDNILNDIRPIARYKELEFHRKLLSQLNQIPRSKLSQVFILDKPIPE